MIHWLVQTVEAHPSLTEGIPPPGILSKLEAAHFTTLKTLKRRSDWLLGRLTAKQLLQSVLEKGGELLPLDVLSVLRGLDGAPVAWVNGCADCTVSISHSWGRAFCAVVEQADWPLGVDIERILPRNPAFVADYFTDLEAQLVENCPCPELLMNAIWSAKESVLKALHLGLKADTRAVVCLIEVEETPPEEWTPFTISYEADRLPGLAPPLVGWWRVMDGYVLTMACKQP